MKTILYILDVLQEAFTKFGDEAEITETAREGINKFDNGPFDLVIIDMLMPDIRLNSKREA